MFNEILKLVCIYLISYGLLLILIELRAHLERSFLIFGLFLIGMSAFAAIDFWRIPAATGEEQRAWLILQHVLVFGCAVLLLWYLVLLSETPQRRPFEIATIVAILFILALPFATFFDVGPDFVIPTMLYLVTVPLFILVFSIANVSLIAQGLRAQPLPQKRRVLRFHLLGFSFLLLCGAYDFVIFATRAEPFMHVLPNGTILGLSLYGAVSTIILTDRLVELVAEKNQYSLLAESDAVTRVGNRRMLSVLLGHGLEFADQSQQPFSAIALDIDSFKTYNDTYGHPVGDEILRQVAANVRAAIRPNDALLRYGGDEFVVLCPDTDAHQVMAIGERICVHIRETKFLIHGHALRVTISVGCATYPTDTTEHDELVNCADRALYVSKHNGKNQVTHAGMGAKVETPL